MVRLGGTGGKALEQAVKAFNEEDRGFTVVGTTVPGISEKLLTAIAGGVPPNVHSVAAVLARDRSHVYPAILFVLLTGLVGMFQYFNPARIMTQGGPLQASELYGIYLYRVAFNHFKMGYASALAWLLFVMIVIGTVILFRTSARWVYYAGDEK